jgi:hypothetical protein
MLDFNLPLLTDAGAASLGEGAINAGAAATANLLRILDHKNTSRVIVGTLALVGGWLAFKAVMELSTRFAGPRRSCTM